VPGSLGCRHSPSTRSLLIGAGWLIGIPRSALRSGGSRMCSELAEAQIDRSRKAERKPNALVRRVFSYSSMALEARVAGSH
jgi:hypothetical protein